MRLRSSRGTRLCLAKARNRFTMALFSSLLSPHLPRLVLLTISPILIFVCFLCFLLFKFFCWLCLDQASGTPESSIDNFVEVNR